MKKLTTWTDVPLFWLDGGRALTERERLTALYAYHQEGGMYGIVMAQPDPGNLSQEECERLSEAGPLVEEIDWEGFAKAIGHQPRI